MKKFYTLILVFFLSFSNFLPNDLTKWKIFNPSNVSCLNSKKITSIEIDKNRTKWIGTDSGLVMIDSNCNCKSYKNIGSISNMVIDTFSNLWMIVIPNDKIIKFDKNNTFKTYKLNATSKSAAICADSSGNVWIGCGQLGLYREKECKIWKCHDESIETLNYWNSYLIKYIADSAGYDPGPICIESDRTNNLWIAVQWGGFFRANIDTFWIIKLYIMDGFNQAFKFAVDSINNVWVILGGGGGSDPPFLRYVNTYNGKKLDYCDTSTFRHSSDQNKICIENERKIWLGLIEDQIQKYSLVVFNPYDSSFTPYDTLCPYLFSRVSDIEIDDLNNVWFATDSGLIVYRDSGVDVCDTIVHVYLTNQPTNYNLDIYPNPSYSNIIIQFEVNNPSKVTISIINNLGVIIKKIVDSQFYDTGIHSIDFDTSDFPSGIYFCVFKSSNFVETKKIIITR